MSFSGEVDKASRVYAEYAVTGMTPKATGLSLVKVSTTKLRNLANTFADAARAMPDVGDTERETPEFRKEVGRLRELYAHIIAAIGETSQQVMERQNPIVAFFYELFHGKLQTRQLQFFLESVQRPFASAVHDTLLHGDPTIKATDVSAHAQFTATKPTGTGSQLAHDIRAEVPKSGSLKKGNEKPILVQMQREPNSQFADDKWGGGMTNFFTRHCGNPLDIKPQPITEKTAQHVKDFICDPANELETAMEEVRAPQQAWRKVKTILGLPDNIELVNFANWPESDRKKLIGFFNVCLSCAAVGDNDTHKFFGNLITLLVIDNNSTYPFNEINNTLYQIATNRTPIMHKGQVDLPKVDALFDAQEGTTQQYAIRNYPDLKFLQYVKAADARLFADAIMDEFGSYAVNANAMRYMQAAIARMDSNGRGSVLSRLSEFANDLARSVRSNPQDANKMNQLRAITELLLANADELRELPSELLTINDSIVQKWDHRVAIRPSEIASVMQIAALKYKKGMRFSEIENKNIAMLTLNPRYGFCQKIYNTMGTCVRDKKFDTIANPNFRSYYGSKDSLVPMSIFGNVPAIKNPAGCITEEDIQSIFSIGHITIDADNGVILTGGCLLVATEEKPPILELIDRSEPHIQRFLAKRSTFPSKHSQCIDGKVTIDLETGKACHADAGDFVTLTSNGQYNRGVFKNMQKHFIAFRDGEGVIRFYTKTNFREPAFLLKDEKFYSAKNPEMELFTDTQLNSDLGLPLDCFVGLDENGKVTEVVVASPVTLEKNENPCPISFVRGGDKGRERLELYADGQKTDRFLVSRNALSPYMPSKQLPEATLLIASDGNPRELTVIGRAEKEELPDEQGFKKPSVTEDKNPTIITLPENENGDLIFGRINSDGVVIWNEGDEWPFETMLVFAGKENTFFNEPNAKNHLRSFISYCRAYRQHKTTSAEPIFSHRNMAAFLRMYKASLADGSVDFEGRGLLAELILELNTLYPDYHHAWTTNNSGDRTHPHNSLISIGLTTGQQVYDFLLNAYKILQVTNPTSPVLRDFAAGENAYAQNRFTDNVGKQIYSRKNAEFYKNEVRHFRRQKNAKEKCDIRAHLPRATKTEKTSMSLAQFRELVDPTATDILGAKVPSEVFKAVPGEDGVDLASAGAGALEKLGISADTLAIPGGGGPIEVEWEKDFTSLRGRLEAYRQKKSASNTQHADTCWLAIQKHFSNFDLAHPENFAITDMSKVELQRDLAAAEASLEVDKAKIDVQYNAINQAIDDVFTHVRPQVKMLRLNGDLPMPTRERLQMRLFSCYDYKKKTINRNAFFHAYAKEFDPYISRDDSDKLVEALQDQLICKTALDACNNRRQAFLDFKKKIEVLITRPTDDAPAWDRQVKLIELNERKAALGRAKITANTYCSHVAAARRTRAEEQAKYAALRQQIAQQRAEVGEIDRKIENNRSAIAQFVDPKKQFANGTVQNAQKKITNDLPRIKSEQTKNTATLQEKEQELARLAGKPDEESYRFWSGTVGKKRVELNGDIAALRRKKSELDHSETVLSAMEQTIADLSALNAQKQACEAAIAANEAGASNAATNRDRAIDPNPDGGIQAVFSELKIDIDPAKLEQREVDEDGTPQLVFTHLEEFIAANDLEIAKLTGDTKGAMLTAKESFGTFIQAMAATRGYDAFEFENFFTLWFEAQTGFRLRPDQVGLVKALFEKVQNGIANGRDVELLFQLMMGGGKTAVVLSEMAQLLTGLGKIALFANHSSQHDTMKKDLGNLQKKRYDQDVIEIDMPSSALKNIENIRKIFSEFERAKRIGACVTGQSTLFRGLILERRCAIIDLNKKHQQLQQLGLQIKEASGKAKEKPLEESRSVQKEIRDLEVKLRELERLLTFIHENCVMICDEVDLNLDPTFSVNIPQGDLRTFSKEQADCIGGFFRHIDENDDIKNALRNGTGIADAAFRTLADELLDDLKVDDDRRELHGNFLLYDDAPGAVNGNLNDAEFRAQWNAERERLTSENPKLLEQLTMLRGLIATERYASRKTYLENYGFRVDDLGPSAPKKKDAPEKAADSGDAEAQKVDVQKKVVKVTPYAAANKPSSGEYAHPIELAIYTYHAYLLSEAPVFGDGSPLDLKFRAFVQKAIDEPGSAEGKFLEQEMPGFADRAEGLKNSNSPVMKAALAKEAYNRLVQIFRSEGAGRGQLLRALTRNDFKFYPAMLEGTSYGQADLTPLLIADSGTPSNRDILSAGFQEEGNSILDADTNMKIFDKWEKDISAGDAVVFAGPGENSTVASMLDAQARAHGNDGKSACAIIDVAGAFKHRANRDVARQMRDYYVKKPNCPFKGFAFFEVDQTTGDAAWWILPKDLAKPPVKLSNNQESTILKEAGISREELCVYFDQDKTTGVDFKLPQSGRALVTVNAQKTPTARFLQGVLRLRGFWAGQTADLCQVVTAGEEQPASHVDRFLSICEATERNQEALLEPRKVGAFIGQLTEKRRIVLERRLQGYYEQHRWAIDHGDSPFVPRHWKDEYERLQEECAEVFLTNADFSPNVWYGRLKNETDAVAYVREKRQQMAETLQKFGLAEEFLQKTDFIAERAGVHLEGKKTVTGGAAVAAGTETQTQTQTEAEAEQQMEVSAESAKNDDVNKLGQPNVDLHCRPATSVNDMSMKKFAKKLLPSLARELTASEALTVARIMPTAVALFGASDVGTCQKKCCEPVPHASDTLEKIPGEIFKAFKEKAFGGMLETDVFIEQMYALLKKVDTIIKKPEHKGKQPNPERESIEQYIGGLISKDIPHSYLTDDNFSKILNWANTLSKYGYSLGQMRAITDEFGKCSAKIDDLVKSEQAKAAKTSATADEEIPDDGDRITLKDFQNNPMGAAAKLQNKLKTGNPFPLIGGLLDLFNIFLKDGETKNSIIGAATSDGFFEAVKTTAGAATAFFSGGKNVDALMKQLPGIVVSVQEKNYVTELNMPRKEEIIRWLDTQLPGLLGRLFVKKDVDAAVVIFRTACKLALPPNASESAKKKLASAILAGCYDEKTGQYDMESAMEFYDELIAGFRGFISSLTDSNCERWGAQKEIAKGVVGLLAKLKPPLFDPLFASLEDAKKYIMEAGGKRADKLQVWLAADGDAEVGSEASSRALTDNVLAVNTWLRRSGITGIRADIFPEEFGASEQFRRPFEWTNDPSSAYARNAQRALVYIDFTGRIKCILLTSTEVEDYGKMIKNGTLKDAFIITAKGEVDGTYLPLTKLNDTLVSEGRRFAIYMQIYNGSIDSARLDENPTMANWLRGVLTEEPWRNALIDFLGKKTHDSAWVHEFAPAMAA